MPDEPENLHAAGAYHATKKDVDSRHNEELTEKWRTMAVKFGNNSLLSLLSRGDLAANEIYYHRNCYIEMVNECNRCDRLNNSENVDRNWKKARGFDKVINYIF